VPVISSVDRTSTVSSEFTVMSMTAETETEPETETETEEGPDHVKSPSQGRYNTSSKRHPASLKASPNGDPVGRKKVLSQHDLLNRYFRRDTVIVKNLDLLRSAVPFA